jgi:hypothetical protein
VTITNSIAISLRRESEKNFQANTGMWRLMQSAADEIDHLTALLDSEYQASE